VDFTVENILIPADHPCFEGHFPGHPVFPAVAQIDLVLDYLQKKWDRDLTIQEIRKAKFPAPILPDTVLHMSLKIQDDIVFWRIFGVDKTYSQGTFQVAYEKR
jgi:3-hydroxymyristoyl/3-hydroxydecanoyl-(acyl carrier protein) dehydratase